MKPPFNIQYSAIARLFCKAKCSSFQARTFQARNSLTIKRYLAASITLLLVLTFQSPLKANLSSSLSQPVEVLSTSPKIQNTSQTSVPKAIIDWIYAISAIASAVAAVLAWAAQLRWSQQYKEATEQIIKSKDTENQALKTGVEALQKAQEETVRAKDSEIQRLKGNTPRALMEYVEDLKKLSDQAIQDKNREIEDLKKKNAPGIEIVELQAARTEIENYKKQLEYMEEIVEEMMFNPAVHKYDVRAESFAGWFASSKESISDSYNTDEVATEKNINLENKQANKPNAQ